MGIRSESRLGIGGDPTTVYEYLADVSRWPEWARAIVKCRVAGGGALRTGSRLEQRVKGTFGARGRTLDVSTADAPQHLVFTGMMGPSPLRWGFDIAPAGLGGAGVVLWVETDTRGLMRVVPGALFRGMVRRVNQSELVAIKSAVESRQNAPSSRAGSMP